MRIAISGSHSLGKSTFVHDFLEAYPDYGLGEEPYRALRHDHEIKFAEEQTQNHIMLQLNYCINQIKQYKPGDKVMCDRCPADYIPYASYSIEHGEADIDEVFVKSLYPLVRDSLKYLDLIVFIPISENYKIDLEDDGHRPTHDFYREWVDNAFKKLYRENAQSVLPPENPPRLVEIVGDRKTRLIEINKIINLGYNR